MQRFLINSDIGIYEPWANYDDVLKELNISNEVDLNKLSKEQVLNLASVRIEIEKRQHSNPIRFYKPANTKIDEFHKCDKKIRFIFGGNRSGKTVGSIVEAIWLALGIHPYKKVVVPNYGWIVSLDFPTCRDVIEPELRKWLPKNEISKWDSQDKIIYLKNGSTIGLKSCDSGAQKFQGASRHWIQLDEESPYPVYQECLMRTVDTGGFIFCAMTPTNGLSWAMDEIYEMAGIDKDIWCIKVWTEENSHLNKDEIEKIEKMISEDEKEMRLHGEFVSFSGLIYKNFRKEHHVLNTMPKWLVNNECYKFMAIDPGIDNPCACTWIAMSKDHKCPEYIVYDDYYESDLTIMDNCRNIVQKTGGDKIEWIILDPWAGSQRNAKSGLTTFDEYTKYIRQFSRDRMWLKRGNRYDKFAQISKIRELLNVNDILQTPQLFVMDSCYATIKEFTRYRYQAVKDKNKNLSEKPQKVYDHTMNCIESFFASNPSPSLFVEEQIPDRKNWYK